MLKSPPIGRTSGPQSPTDSSRKVSLQTPVRFQPGELLMGKVLRTSPEGPILIGAKGGQFLATTEALLSEGEKYQFQVKRTHPRIELKVVEGKAQETASLLRLWLSTRAERDHFAEVLMNLAGLRKHLTLLSDQAKHILHKLDQLFPLVVYHGNANEDATWLFRSLMANGIFWENKLARHLLGAREEKKAFMPVKDLKGLLHLLIHAFQEESSDSKELKSWIDTAEQALRLIEKDQFLNISATKEGWGWFWFLPGLRTGDFRKAEIFGRKSDEKKETHLSMWLDLSELGQVQVEVSLFGSNIGLRITVEDDSKRRLVDKDLHVLEKGLRNRGLRVNQMRCDIRQPGELIMPFIDKLDEIASIHLVI